MINAVNVWVRNMIAIHFNFVPPDLKSLLRIHFHTIAITAKMDMKLKIRYTTIAVSRNWSQIMVIVH